MINWLLETVSIFVGLFGNNVFLTILYLLVNSCGTPLVICFTYIFCHTFVIQVYFLGIEENRRLAREHFQSRIMVFKRSQVATIKNKEI